MGTQPGGTTGSGQATTNTPVVIGAGALGGSSSGAGGGGTVGAGQSTTGTGVAVGTGAVGGATGGGDVGGSTTPSVAPVGDGNLPLPEEQPPEVKPVDPNAKPTDTITCPSPDTPILLSDGSHIAAGQLKAGMRVRTVHEHTGNWGDYPVSRVQIVKDKRLCLVLDQGRFICSPSHKFSTGRGWKEARGYKPGDALQHRTVLAVAALDDGDVVSITVDDAHTYISQGLLSHNKTPIFVPPPDITPPPSSPPPEKDCEPGYEKNAAGACVPITLNTSTSTATTTSTSTATPTTPIIWTMPNLT
jgi:hypothetical protein